MPILSAQTSFTGLSGIQPNLVFIDTNDTVATVTTAGYLTHAVQEGLLTLQNGYMALVNTTINQAHGTPRVPIWLQVSITGIAPNLVYSLVTPVNGGGAIFEGNVQAGSNGISGLFISYPVGLNDGFLILGASNSPGNFTTTITNAAMGQNTVFTIPDPGVAAANFLLTQSAGTQTIATGNLILATGTMTLGSSGHASSLTLFPATAANGTLIISPLNAGGAFNTTIRNSVMAQSTVFSIPDPTAATANFLVAGAALVNNHLVKASGTAGATVDAGFGLIAATTAAYGGGGTSNAFAAAGVTAASIVSASILASTNAVSITKVVPGAGTLTVSFSADPGAATTVNYISALV